MSKLDEYLEEMEIDDDLLAETIEQYPLPEPETEEELHRYRTADGVLDGNLTAVWEDWYSEFQQTADSYLSGDADEEELVRSYLDHPVMALTDPRSIHKFRTATGIIEEIGEQGRIWQATVRIALDMDSEQHIELLYDIRDDMEEQMGQPLDEMLSRVEAWKENNPDQHQALWEQRNDR